MASVEELSEEGKEFVVDFRAAWEQLDPQPGEVVEVFMPPQTDRSASAPIWAAFLVMATSVTFLGARVLRCKFMGSSDVALNRELSGLFNRKQGFLHLCNNRPCFDVDEYALHVTQLRWWSFQAFDADYFSAANRKQNAKWYEQAIGGRSSPPIVVGALPKSSAKGPVEEGIPDELNYSPEKEFQPPAPGEEAKTGSEEVRRRSLQERLKGVRERIFPGGPGANLEPPGHWAPGAGGTVPEGLSPEERGPRMNSGSALYALPGVPPQGPEPKALRDTIMSGSKGPGRDLLQQAMLVEQERRKKKHRKKKRKDGGHQLAQALRSVINKKKKKKPDGGDPPSESSPSSKGGDGRPRKTRKRKRLPDGTTVSFSDYSIGTSEESSSSSDTELEAPLKKRSRDRPGSVMEMLVAHVTAQLNQGALLDLADSSHSLVTGVKIVTYFQLNVRPIHGQAQKEMREMFALAHMLDAMRRGDLPSAGDIAAARFMAIHQSLNDGNWGSAKHMEICPLEDSQAASPALLLATRRHSKIFQKLQYGDNYGGGGSGYGRGRGRRQWSNWGQEGDRGETAGRGKGKSGKAKGKQKTGGKNSQGNNPWAASLEKTEDANKPPAK